MERWLLWIIFGLSLVLAFALLNDAQHLPVDEMNTRQFNVIAGLGYIMALMTLVSGGGLAAIYRN